MKYLFVLLFSSTICFSHEIRIVGDDKVFVGDSLKLVLEINDTNTFLKEEIIKELEDKENNLGPFYIISTEFIKKQDSFSLIGFEAIYEKNIKKNTLDFKYLDKIYSVNILSRDLLDVKNLNASKEYYLIDRDLSLKDYTLIYSLVLFLIILSIIVLAYFFWKQMKLREERKKRKQSFDFWDKFFKNAYTRENYEKIIKENKQWEEFIDKSKTKDFFNLMNEYQYKESWTQVEMSDVTKSFEKMRSQLVYGI